MKFKDIVEIFITFFKLYYIYLFISCFGWIIGIAAVCALHKLYFYLIYQIFELEHIRHLDKFHIDENFESIMNVSGVFYIKNFDEKKIKDFFINKFVLNSRFQCRAVYTFFNYFWTKVNLEEVQNKIFNEKVMLVKDEEQLLKSIETEANARIDFLGELPYNFRFYKYENSSEGVVFLKLDHTLADGLAFISYICLISDNFDMKKFPSILSRKIPLKKRIIDLITFPYYILLAMLCKQDPSSPLKFDPKNFDKRGHSLISLSQQFDFIKWQNIARANKVSFNDLCVAATTSAFGRYFKRHNIENIPKSLLVCYPMGLGTLPKNLSELKVQNKTSGVLSQVPLIFDHVKSVKNVSDANYQSLINTIIPLWRVLQIEVFYYLFPTFILNNMRNDFTLYTDFTVSNMPGTKDKIILNGCEVEKFFATNTTGRGYVYVVIISYDQKFTFTLNIDKELNINPKEIQAIIDEINQELMEQN